MRKNKAIKTVLISITILIVLIVCSGAAYVVYRHEHEVNSRIADIVNSVKAIEKAMTEKPVKLIEGEMNQFNSDLNKQIAETYDLNGYQKIINGQDIKLLFVGDSICCYSWVEGTAEWIENNFNINVTYRNMSFPANSSYTGYVTVKRMEPDDIYDIAIICYGQNDSPDGFSANYESIIRALLEKNPKGNIICILEASQREYTEKMKAIIELADYYDISVADAIETHNSSGEIFLNLSADGVHPNELGSSLYLKAVTDAMHISLEKCLAEKGKLMSCLINGKNPSNAGYYREYAYPVPEPMNRNVEKLQNCTFIPAGDFIRVSDTVYEITIEEQDGLIGIDRIMVPGENTVRIFCDGECCYNGNWEIGRTFELEQFFPLEEMTLRGIVQVEIETADKFLGLVITNDGQSSFC